MDKLHINAILAITRLSFGLDKPLVKALLIQPGREENIYEISTFIIQTNHFNNIQSVILKT